MRAQEQECAQEEVAEPRIVRDDRAQIVGGDRQHAPALAHDGGEVGHFLGQQVELADDLARLAHADDARGDEGWLDELDLSLEDDVEVAGELALLEEHLTVLRLLHLPVRAENVDLLVGQRPEGLAGGIVFAVGCHVPVSIAVVLFTRLAHRRSDLSGALPRGASARQWCSLGSRRRRWGGRCHP